MVHLWLQREIHDTGNNSEGIVTQLTVNDVNREVPLHVCFGKMLMELFKLPFGFVLGEK
jgi:hypothetical protein